MKTKNKLLALLEIAIVLCSVFLVALPATVIAAEQATQKVSASEVATASEDEYVLGIYGNANEDDTIDMRDFTYTARIICWLEEEADLADANYDGEIDVGDMTQIGLIILGRESELTIVDGAGRIVTVKKPVDRIIVLTSSSADLIRVLETEYQVVGVDSSTGKEEVLLPVMSELPTVGGAYSPDWEAILALEPNLITTYSSKAAEYEEKVEDMGLHIPVISADLSPPDTVEDIKKFGYILDKREKAEEFIEWYESYMDTIKDQTEGLSEDEKPEVFLNLYPKYYGYYKAFGKDTSGDIQCKIAGGKNIVTESGSVEVEPEWLVWEDPDIIIATVTSGVPSGYGVDDITGVEAIREDILDLNITENVYVVASDIRHGVQDVICIAYWAKWFHPELFGGLDPQAIHQEYLDRFQRIDYDITEQGVFVFPPT